MRKLGVASFDLFDTLVARRCISPHEIFKEVEEHSGRVGFSQARIAAEAHIYGKYYTLFDIYSELQKRLDLSVEETLQLSNMELEHEYKNFIRIAENCETVSAGDIIVSDMYLPFAFVRKIVTEVCGLPFCALFISSHGKSDRSVWVALLNHFDIKNHVGDNGETDYRGPQEFGINCRLDTLSRPTIFESDLIERGLGALAKLVREARLTSWTDDVATRQAQNAQTLANFPLLFLASLHLINTLRANGWTKILFSSRDCYLWLQLFKTISAKFSMDVKVEYFYTSRLSKANASDAYIEYFRDLIAGENCAIVDVCGTGWSNRRLLEKAGVIAGIYLIHHMEPIEIYDEIGRVTSHLPITSVAGLTGDNGIFEVLNCTHHPMVEDVRKVFGSHYPVFSDFEFDPHQKKLVSEHHNAFLQSVSLATSLTEHELTEMLPLATLDNIQIIYNHMRDFGGGLGALFEHQQSEEGDVWNRMLERRVK